MKCINCNCEEIVKTKIGFESEGGYPEGLTVENEIKIRGERWIYSNLNAYKCNKCGFVMLFNERD